MAKYFLSDLAVDDLADIRRYVAADSPDAAKRLITSLFDRFDLLVRHPKLGAKRSA